MAPKRQRPAPIPPQEPTAPPPPADPFRFENIAAEQAFQRAMHRRPCLFENRILYDDPPENRLQGVLADIEARGWGFLLDDTMPVANISWVREFYANLWDTSAETLYLRGRQIPLSATSIRTILALPEDPEEGEPDDYQSLLEDIQALNLDEIRDRLTHPGSEWVFTQYNQPNLLRGTHLTLEARAWMRILFSHIIPCSHVSDLSLDNALMLYCLVEGRRIDLPSRILAHMRQVPAAAVRVGLPYPVLITRMATACGVQALPDDLLQTRFPSVTVAGLVPKDAAAKKKASGGPPADNPYGALLASMEDLKVQMQERARGLKQSLRQHITDTVAASERRIMRRIARLEERVAGAQREDSEEADDQEGSDSEDPDAEDDEEAASDD